MLFANLFEHLGGGAGTASLHILVTPADCCHRLFVVLPFVFQKFSEYVI